MNRRKFVLASTGFLSATGLGPRLAAAPQAASASATKGLLIGTVTYNLGRSWDLETLIKNCTEAQFDGVELRTTHAHGVELSLTPQQRKDIRKRFEDSPVTLVQLGTTCEYHSPDRETLRKNIEESKAWVKLAHDVGAAGIKVRPNDLPQGVPEEKTLEQIGRSIHECAEFAAGYGVEIRLEIHGRETARIPRIQKILEHARHHPSFTLNWNSNPQDLMDEGFEANFQALKSKISHVHLRDLFDESYPFRRLVQLLQAMNFQGYSLAEIPESSDPVRLMKYFRALWRSYQGLL